MLLKAERQTFGLVEGLSVEPNTVAAAARKLTRRLGSIGLLATRSCWVLLSSGFTSCAAFKADMPFPENCEKAKRGCAQHQS